MAKYLRYLRIAWTVFCGIACVLVIMLWVRSYWRIDVASGSIGSIDSVQGSFTCCWWKERPTWSNVVISKNLDELQVVGDTGALTALYGFDFQRDQEGLLIKLPHWILVLATASVAVAPWIRWRFTIRTLLFATTLVALVLGAVVYAIR